MLITPEMFGAVGNGIIDDSVALSACFAATNGIANLLPNKTYLHLSPLSPTCKIIQGEGKNISILKYGGSGLGIYINQDTQLRDLTIEAASNSAITVYVAGLNVRKTQLQNIFIYGNSSANNTGIGLYIDAASDWIGGIDLDNIMIQGFKNAIYCSGDGGSNIVTTLIGKNVWLVGRSGGIITGSHGIYMDSGSGMPGSIIFGGAIEGFDVGIQSAGASRGISYIGGLEGNNLDFYMGEGFTGTITNLYGNN